MLRGWIIAPEGDRQRLEELGVELGEYDITGQSFEDCVVSEEAMERLNPLWGMYIWGLEHVTDNR